MLLLLKAAVMVLVVEIVVVVVPVVMVDQLESPFVPLGLCLLVMVAEKVDPVQVHHDMELLPFVDGA